MTLTHEQVGILEQLGEVPRGPWAFPLAAVSGLVGLGLICRVKDEEGANWIAITEEGVRELARRGL